MSDNDAQAIVEDLVAECLARLPDAGEAAVELVCTGHPEHMAAVRRVLRSLTRVGLVGDGEPMRLVAARPQLVGEYRLLRCIGGGGMGEVYLAEQPRLKRHVALKLIRHSLALSANSRARFAREIEAISALDHPGICPVFDAGEVDGMAYLAMRYLEGESLAARIERARAARLPPAAALDVAALIEKTARALHHAHERGVVHRDVKPANVMIAPAGDPVLVDFGLAQLADSAAAGLTRTGDPLGTPAYMAPEQVAGKPIDRRSDVYALAATAYEALTLRCPHEAPTREALYRAILDGEVEPASRHNRHVPRDLDVVLATALDPDPDHRYQTALDFAEDLGRVRAKLPIRARPAPWPLRARRVVTRHPVLSVALVLLAAALAVAMVLVEQLRRSLRRAEAVALANASADAEQKDHLLALQMAVDAVRRLRVPETVAQLHRSLGAANERLAISVAQPRAVAISPHTGRIAVGALDGRVRVFTTNGELSVEFANATGPDVAINSLAFSPADPETLLVAGRDKAVRIWQLTGEPPKPELRCELAHDRAVARAVFARDARSIATVEGPGLLFDAAGGPWKLRRWDLDRREPTLTREFRRWLYSVDFVGSNGDIVVGGSDGAVLVSAGGEVRANFASDDVVTHVAATGDGRILTTSADGLARIWATADLARPRHTLPRHGGWPYGGAWSSDGALCVTASEDQTVRLFTAEGELVRTFRGHADLVLAAAFDSAGRSIVTASNDGTVRVWDLSVPGVATLRGHRGPVYTARFALHDGCIVTGAHDRTAQLWGLDGRATTPPLLHAAAVHAVAAAPDGSEIASACTSPGTTHPIQRWDLRGNRLGTLSADAPGYTGRIEYSPNGARLLVTNSMLGASLFARDGRLLRTLAFKGWPLMSAVFSPDGGTALCAQHDGQIRLWDLAHDDSQPAEYAIAPERGLLWFACFLGDRDHVITCHSHEGTGTALVWEVRPDGLRLVRALMGHEGAVVGAAFSPQHGGRIATCSRDGTARLWTVDGEPITALTGHTGTVWQVAFAPDGRSVVTASGDGTARVWRVETDDALDLAEQRLRARRR